MNRYFINLRREIEETTDLKIYSHFCDPWSLSGQFRLTCEKLGHPWFKWSSRGTRSTTSCIFYKVNYLKCKYCSRERAVFISVRVFNGYVMNGAIPADAVTRRQKLRMNQVSSCLSLRRRSWRTIRRWKDYFSTGSSWQQSVLNKRVAP